MKKLIRNSTAEILIFTAQAGNDSIEVRVDDETVWLTQKLMVESFQKLIQIMGIDELIAPIPALVLKAGRT